MSRRAEHWHGLPGQTETRRARGLLLALSLLLWGCPDGQSRYVPPQATAAPGGSQVFVYVAEARNSSVGTDGGAVSAYQLGADGLLPGGAPLSTVEVVNPTRLRVHPALPVLYVATRSQILAFDISDGSLRSLCDDTDTGLAPPCATFPRGDDRPFDMAVHRADDGTYTLYVAEQGSPGTTGATSRIAAYPLGDAGELPGYAGSQGTGSDVVQFEAVGISSLFAWGADTSVQRVYRFDREADGSLPFEAPTPTPINFPTPSPTPTQVDPTPSPDPTPTPQFFSLNFPGRLEIREFPVPSPAGDVGVLYAVEEGSQRLGAWHIDEFGDLPAFPDSESPIQGFYNSILIAPDRSRIYGALFQDGGVSSYMLDENGNIQASTQTITFENAASYPTGLAWLEFTPSGGSPEKVVFVSLGGLDRVDGYRVNDNGSLESRPFTSTEPRDGTFPSDVAVNVLP